MGFRRSTARTQNTLLTIQLCGDAAFCYLGLVLSYWLRFHSPLRHIGIEATNLTLTDYQPLLFLGALFLIFSYSYLNVYDGRLLLRPHRALSLIFKGTFFWVLVFLGVSLALKFEPAISRFFVAIAGITTLGAMVSWRYFLFEIVRNSGLREKLVQKVVIIGWNADAARLAESIHSDANHPYDIFGVIASRDEVGADAIRPFHSLRSLGSIRDFGRIVDENAVDIAVVADLELSKEQLFELVGHCERRYVSFKIIPSFFQIFVSNLRMQTISGVPILGVEELPITSTMAQITKRLLDIIGASAGLLLSAPVMAMLAILIKRESRGPVFYRQVRTGLHGRTFTIYKMRSMRIDAEVKGTGWTVKDDPRRTKIGTFMRETNLDELPQFWNILRGDMSLVGPRPERPELIKKFEHEIPHYNPRHEVRPGLTGWAQVNGLRGDTSLTDRVKYDLYYIENWSFWFDIQIMLLTFLKRKNAY